MKPTYRIEDWVIACGSIYGNIIGHPRCSAVGPHRTSDIVSRTEGIRKGDTVETVNSFYVLGEPQK